MVLFCNMLRFSSGVISYMLLLSLCNNNGSTVFTCCMMLLYERFVKKNYSACPWESIMLFITGYLYITLILPKIILMNYF